jgi:aspartate aminotransferase
MSPTIIRNEVSIVRFSRNVDSLVPSATLALRARAKRMQAEGHSVIDLSAGEPSFATPAVATEAALRSIHDGRGTGYPPTPGVPELREAAARYVEETTAHPSEDAAVLVSAGVKQALFNLAYCLFEDGDEVLVPAPYWPTYLAVVELAGAAPVVVPTPWQRAFRIDLEELERLRTPRTRGLFLNSPANPSGHVYDRGLLEDLCAWAARNDIWILSDEIYRRLYYRGEAAPSVFDVPERSHKVVLLDGVSKTFSMPGWRIGFAVAPPELIGKASALQSQTTSGAAGPSQYAAAGVISSPERERIIAQFKEVLDRRRRAAVAGLRGIAGLDVAEPEGAIYLYVRLTDAEESAAAAESLLVDSGVACVPGEAFGTPGFLRLNYSVDDAELEEGIARIAAHFGG